MIKGRKIKNILFNERLYSKITKTLVFSFILFMFLFKIFGADKVFGLIFVITISVIFVTYYLYKILYIKREIKDIIYLIIFLFLSGYGIYNFYIFFS